MSSGLIYAAIVAMWALVLVPMWLRRHDAVSESKSVDRFSTAMRILSRRTPASGDKRYLVMPRRTEAVSAFTTADPVGRRPARSSGRPARRPARPAPTAGRARLLARRRRVLSVLGGLAALTFLLAAAGAMSWWWQLVVDVAGGAYLMHLRAEAIRARELAARRRRRARSAYPAEPVETPFDSMPAPAEASAPVQPEPALADLPAGIPAGTQAGTAEPVEIPDGWEPVPVPLPTYVTAPVAERRVVDWSAEHLLDDIAEVTADIPAEDDDAFLEEIVERRRAVND